MSDKEIHEGDIGTALRYTVYEDGSIVDLSTVSTKTLTLIDPNGKKLTKTLVFVTDGTDGQVQYVTITGDLSKAGAWQAQLRLVFPGGDWTSDIKNFDVLPKL